MSDTGPSQGTRAASRAASRETTPAPVTRAQRSGRATRDVTATPATARRTRRGGSQVAPDAHDGDEDLPAIPNKTSKAYGSAGKMTDPVQMDFTQTQQGPESAINTALAQAQARTSGALPTVSESAVESQPEVEAQPIHRPRTASQSLSSRRNSRRGSAIENRGLVPLGNIDNTAWAPHAGGLWVGGLQAFFRNAMYTIGGTLLYLCDSIVAFFARLNPLHFLLWSMALFVVYTLLELTHGPLLRYDPPLFQSWRDVMIKNNTMEDVGAWQIQILENRVSIVERIAHTFFSDKPASGAPPRINWFEIGQGAVVDPYYSSPTYVPKVAFSMTTFLASLFAFRVHGSGPLFLTQGPAEALTHWNEGGLDRWCAPSSRGKLQLTVNVARPIAPEELIIEHIAKGATISVGMAPREVELWVEVENEIDFFEMQRAIIASQPSLLQDSSPDCEKQLAPAQALPETFLPIARFYYDVYGNQAVQSFAVPFNLAAMGIKTSRIAIRANSNWGSYDATCINRVRLHGVDMSGEEAERLHAPL